MTSINPFTLRKTNKLMAQNTLNLQKSLLIQEGQLRKAEEANAVLRKKIRDLNTAQKNAPSLGTHAKKTASKAPIQSKKATPK